VGHHITALAIADHYDREVAHHYGLVPRLTYESLVVFPIDHYWSAYWQAKRGNIDGVLALPAGMTSNLLPSEGVVRTIARELTRRVVPKFALLQSDYFGGSGEQWSVVFEGECSLLAPDARVNDALHELGVKPTAGKDAWDTIGLAGYRHNPDHLHRFRDLCDQLGV
jgi:hypothetical protein